MTRHRPCLPCGGIEETVGLVQVLQCRNDGNLSYAIPFLDYFPLCWGLALEEDIRITWEILGPLPPCPPTLLPQRITTASSFPAHGNHKVTVGGVVEKLWLH